MSDDKWKEEGVILVDLPFNFVASEGLNYDTAGRLRDVALNALRLHVTMRRWQEGGCNLCICASGERLIGTSMEDENVGILLKELWWLDRMDSFLRLVTAVKSISRDCNSVPSLISRYCSGIDQLQHDERRI